MLIFKQLYIHIFSVQSFNAVGCVDKSVNKQCNQDFDEAYRVYLDIPNVQKPDTVNNSRFDGMILLKK